jgi:hypothetical protein
MLERPGNILQRGAPCLSSRAHMEYTQKVASMRIAKSAPIRPWHHDVQKYRVQACPTVYCKTSPLLVSMMVVWIRMLVSVYRTAVSCALLYTLLMSCVSHLTSCSTDLITGTLRVLEHRLVGCRVHHYPVQSLLDGHDGRTVR